MSEFLHAFRLVYGFLRDGTLMAVTMLIVALVIGNFYNAFVGPLDFWSLWQVLTGIGLSYWLAVVVSEGVVGLKRGMKAGRHDG